MAGRGRGKDDYVIEKIITHIDTKTILDNGSHFPYSQEDLEKSKCQYAFLVSWKDYEGEFTWQSFESFDGNLAENYGRREGLELLGRLRGLRDSQELRRRVDEIEVAQKQRHLQRSVADSNKPSSSHTLAKKKDKNDDPKTREIDEKKKTTEAAKHEVIELESESEGEVKKSVRENVKKKMNLDMGMDQGSRSTSYHVLEKAHVKGLRIHSSRENKNEMHKSKNLMEAAKNGVQKGLSQLMNIRRQRQEEAKKKEKKNEEKKIKKMENENRRRRAIASNDESDEDDDSKEEKKKKKNHSKEWNKTDHGETSMKRSIKTKRDRVVPMYEQSDDGLEYSPIKKRKDSKEEDGIMIKKEDDKRSNRESKDEEKRRSKNRSPKEGKKKQINREDEHGCWSDESSDESGGEWEVDEVKMHVKVQEVLDGRDIEGRDELNWDIIHKTQIPIIFRVLFKSMKQGWKYKKYEWLTMEEMDNLPKLNRYADMAKLVLPKGYESLMKKKVAKDYDDIFKA